MSVLIVDDAPDNRLLLKAILEKAGYQELLFAESAAEAFMQLGLSEHVGQETSIELIFMDVMMPEMNGIEACRRIRKASHLRNIPIIMCTAKSDMDSLDEAFEAGAVDYVTKPIRKIELLARMRSSLRLSREMKARMEREHELKKKNDELVKAMQEINTLRGFLPICAYCKKIRGVEGYWTQLEAYLQKNSEVKFSHGICDPCMKTRFPNYTEGAKKSA